MILLRVKEEPGKQVADAVRLVTGTKLVGFFRAGTIRAVLRKKNDIIASFSSRRHQG